MARKPKKIEVVKPKKEPSLLQIRARERNLKKAQEAAAVKRQEQKLAKLDQELEDIHIKVDDKLDKKIEAHLKKLDRAKLKDDFLKVFYTMGGPKALKKWAKDKPGDYFKLMVSMIKAETEKEAGGGGGVTVNIHGLPGDAAIDITPEKK